MILTIDIGNSNTVFGLFHSSHLKQTWRVVSNTTSITAWFKKNKNISKKIETITLASVVPNLTFVAQKSSRAEFKKTIHLITASSFPLKIKVKAPQKIGIDRLIDAYAAHSLWKNKNVLVIDLGTATTLDVITAQGEFLGGLILPGPKTMHQSLHDYCAQLPLLPLKKLKTVIGKSTEEAIQSGVYWGYVGMIEGLIKKIKQQFKSPLFVVATGGLASLMAADVAAIDKIHPTLTLEGLSFLS